MGVDLEKFLTARDRALRSLDKATILAYYREYGEEALANEMSKPEKETALFAGIHRARLSLDTFSEEEKAVSREWLRSHGYEPRGL